MWHRGAMSLRNTRDTVLSGHRVSCAVFPICWWRVSAHFAFFLFAAPLFGGCGLYLDLGNPQASGDPAASNAFITMRVFNCIGAMEAGNEISYPAPGLAISVTAEGLVEGHRLSVPLRVRKLREPGLSALYWARPEAGSWALNVTVTGAGDYYIGGIVPDKVGTLVALKTSGIDRRPHLLFTAPDEDEVKSFFRSSSSVEGAMR